jgi:hypothetical protein
MIAGFGNQAVREDTTGLSLIEPGPWYLKETASQPVCSKLTLYEVLQANLLYMI